MSAEKTVMWRDKRISEVTPGRYGWSCWAASIALTVATVYFVLPWAWPALMFITLVAGVLGFLVGGRLDARRRQTAARSGLLPFEEFSELCASYAKPKVDLEPELPTSLPEALRDPGFLVLVKPSAEEVEAARRAWLDHPILIDTLDEDRRLHEVYDQLKRARRIGRPGPIVAERSFEPLTHCPEGHSGWHWVGHRSEHEGRPVVGRTCLYTRCGKTWLEGA